MVINVNQNKKDTLFCIVCTSNKCLLKKNGLKLKQEEVQGQNLCECHSLVSFKTCNLVIKFLLAERGNYLFKLLRVGPDFCGLKLILLLGVLFKKRNSVCYSLLNHLILSGLDMSWTQSDPVWWDSSNVQICTILTVCKKNGFHGCVHPNPP